MAAGVLAQMFAEIPPGLAARLVQGAAVNPAGPEAEAEAGAGAEGSVGGVKGLLMVFVLTFVGLRTGRALRNITIYRKLTRCNGIC